jgi:hypothetical protein
MTQSWRQRAKSAYRKDQVSSFVLIVGAVDAVIGSVGNYALLLGLGWGTVGLAIVLRWVALRRRNLQLSAPPLRVLPERSTRPLPPLDLSQRKKP